MTNTKQTKIITIALVAVVLVALTAGLLFFKQKINSGKEPAVGNSTNQRAPAFSLTTIDGQLINDQQLEKQIVVITSSAAWCPTCKAEAEQFSPIYQKYKDRGVIFLTIDIDPRDSKEFISRFRTNTNTPWDYADANDAKQMIRDYKLNRFEITYIIDQRGIIRFKDNIITTSEKLDLELAKILN